MSTESPETLVLKSPSITPAHAATLLWHQGILHWMLHDGQKSLYDSFHNCQEKIVVWNCSRRLGKSFCLCVIAIETCLKNPNALVKYCCAKQTDATKIIRPLIREIITSCPKELRPIFKVSERSWVFPNGSRIELAGLDGGHAESMRGGSTDVAIIDEAGLVTDLKYIIRSILLPTTTTTQGKIILASTPPKTSAHPFITEYVNKARIQGNLVTKTIYDNPLIDKDELEKIKEEYGGVDSIEFQREFLCRVLISEEHAVVPEFTYSLKEKIVKEWERAPFYDCYVAMDLGVKDFTVVLFAWYDFRASKLIIEDEFCINGQKFNTTALAQGIKTKESDNFTDKLSGEQRLPYLRVSDNSLTVINDLWQLHGLRFLATAKTDADAALNNMRVLLQNERIIINPRCKTLINHLESAIWNKNKSSMDRSVEGGHFDAVDSLKYLVRNVQLNKNPYPASYGAANTESSFSWNTQKVYPQHQQMSQILNLKPKKNTAQLPESVKLLMPKKKW